MGESCEHDCSRKRPRAESEEQEETRGGADAADGPAQAAPATDRPQSDPRQQSPPFVNPAEAGRPHPRLADLPAVRTVLDGVLSPELCRELVFLLRSCGTVGYRPHVRSATIHDVVATAPCLLPPLVRARHAVLSAVEAAFGLSLELAVEFTGLIAWTGGAALGWHHDANREYLARRHLSAVLYLTNQGDDFGEGDFRFQDGPGPLRVAPRAGRLVAYTADARNVHCVEWVGWGERCTLTCWFSLDPAAAEDGKVLQQLCRGPTLLEAPQPHLDGCATSPTPRAFATSPTLPVSTLAPTAVEPAQPEGRDTPECSDASAVPGRPDTVDATRGSAVLCGSWWRRCLGPGLPSTMYQQPQSPADANGSPGGGAGGGRGGGGAAEREGGSGDLRLLRLRQLGLHVKLQAPTSDGRCGGRGDGGCSSDRAAGSGGQRAAAEGAGKGPLDSGALEGDPARARTTPPAVGATEGGLAVEPLVAWQAGHAEEREPQGREEVLADEGATAAAVEEEAWVGVHEDEMAQPLRFPNLSAALLAAQFASYSTGVVRFRSAAQLEAALSGLPDYMAQRMEELRLHMPTWLALGSLLSSE